MRTLNKQGNGVVLQLYLYNSHLRMWGWVNLYMLRDLGGGYEPSVSFYTAKELTLATAMTASECAIAVDCSNVLTT